LLQQQQFLILVFIQFVLYTQQNLIISKISVSQKNLFTKTLFISFVSMFSAVVQQSILYMSVLIFKFAEASYFNKMNVTEFFEK